MHDIDFVSFCFESNSGAMREPASDVLYTQFEREKHLAAEGMAQATATGAPAQPIPGFLFVDLI